MGFKTQKVGSENVGNLFNTEKKSGVAECLAGRDKKDIQLPFSPSQHRKISTTVSIFTACFSRWLFIKTYK